MEIYADFCDTKLIFKRKNICLFMLNLFHCERMNKLMT